MEKRIQEGIHNNFKNLITKLTNVTLSSSKIKYGLKHGLAVRPNKSDMIVIMEDIYEKTLRYNAIKGGYTSQERLKTTL